MLDVLIGEWVVEVKNVVYLGEFVWRDFGEIGRSVLLGVGG